MNKDQAKDILEFYEVALLVAEQETTGDMAHLAACADIVATARRITEGGTPWAV